MDINIIKAIAKEAAEIIATVQEREERFLTEREIYNIIRDTAKRQNEAGA